MRYLDPKNDLIFKRVFGENANIVMCFLNGVMPLEPNQKITYIEYLPAELVPELPTKIKNSIVDVRCIDNFGRQFIVEMQMLWTDSFKSRVLFNASKAFVRQLRKGKEYNGLQPVYALSIVNEIFEPNMDEWYHHYKIVHVSDQQNVIEGLQLVFVELPKFNKAKLTGKKLMVLWMRYLSEIKNGTEMIDEELLAEMMTIPEMEQALELTKESSYTAAELEAYDRYWDAISVEKTFIADAEAKGKTKGKAEGKAEGELAKTIATVLKLDELGSDILFIAQALSLTEAEVKKILQK